MAGRKRTAKAQAASGIGQPKAVNALTASAVRMDKPSPRRVSREAVEWQREAWYFYDTIGELRFAANWLGNALSRVKLVLRQETQEGDVEVTEGPAFEALRALFGGEAGQSQMLATYGIHMTVPGETYLVGEPQDEGGPDHWMVLSGDELKPQGDKWQVDRGDGGRDLHAESMVIRLWRRHPRRWVEADSPTRAVLPILRELEQLSKHVGATVDSRLAGAGLLLLPNELTFASPLAGSNSETEGTGEIPDGVDPLMRDLGEAMTTPIADRASAASVVPFFLKGPAEVLDKVQHLSFATPFDAMTPELRNELLRRFALGMDLPPEIVLGQGDTNHWSAWQIDEAAIKIHVEPLLELLCAALVEEYLAPVLEAAGDMLPEGMRVEGDTSDLRLRPNRSQDAKDLYDRLEINGAALRRESGFEESDRPTIEDMRSAILRKAASGVTTADLTLAAMRALGVDIAPQPALAPTEGGSASPPGGAGATRGEDQTPLDVPDLQNEQPENVREIPEAAALEFACQLVVHRACERAFNKVGKRLTRIPAERLDDALVGAWELAGMVAERFGVDQADLTRALDGVTRYLLATGPTALPADLVIRQALEPIVSGRRGSQLKAVASA